MKTQPSQHELEFGKQQPHLPIATHTPTGPSAVARAKAGDDDHDPLCHQCADQAELIDLLVHAIEHFNVNTASDHTESNTAHYQVLIGLTAAAQLTGAFWADLDAALTAHCPEHDARANIIAKAHAIRKDTLDTLDPQEPQA